MLSIYIYILIVCNRLHIWYLVLTTDIPSESPSESPSETPSKSPSKSPTTYSIYDLTLTFYIEVKDKEEQQIVYQEVQSYGFFYEYKAYLLQQLEAAWFLNNYDEESQADFLSEINSMQQAPFSDIGIISPTFSPTPYPTYDYEAGEGNLFLLCLIQNYIILYTE